MNIEHKSLHIFILATFEFKKLLKYAIRSKYEFRVSDVYFCFSVREQI